MRDAILFLFALLFNFNIGEFERMGNLPLISLNNNLISRRDNKPRGNSNSYLSEKWSDHRKGINFNLYYIK